MRNLTLGALIVFGGILAALPFRKSDLPCADGNGDSTLATGPSADLSITDELVPYNQLFAPCTSGLEVSANASPAGSPASLASAMRSPDRPRGLPSNAVASPRRDLRLPLTYDDLAVPLASPHYTDGRFDALANRQASETRAAVTSETQPVNPARSHSAFEPLQVAEEHRSAKRPAAPWEMSKDLPESILHKSPIEPMKSPLPSPSVPGRLASDSQPRATDPVSITSVSTERTGESAVRERHWIRQPD